MALHPGQSSPLLTLRLGEAMFALDVAQVREILDVTSITKVPRAPEFMRGVINVRGSVVPVVDLRLKFGLPPTPVTVDTRIVVMEIALDGELITIGAMADAVHDVMELDLASIEEPPNIGAQWNADFIKGIGKHKDEFIILLDVDKIFSSNEITGAIEPMPEV
jgi:purine-binding chemotaxis protein CheW